MGPAQAPYYLAPVLYPKEHLTEHVRDHIILRSHSRYNRRTYVTTALQECDFIRTFDGPQSPQVLPAGVHP